MHARIALFSLAAALAACSDSSVAPRTTGPRLAASSSATLGGVFVETNASTGNAIVAFTRAADGSLTPSGTYPTGGLGVGGTVDPLLSQFAVALSADDHALYAVNAGSNSITAFAVNGGTLSLIGTVASNGVRPVSVAVGSHTLYALNATSNTVTAFAIAQDGSLAAIPGFTRALTAGAAGAAEVRLSPDGRLLVVAERVSNTFDVFGVNADGSLTAPVQSASAGVAPFGFDFTPRGQLVGSEAGTNSASSYTIGSDLALTTVTGVAETFQRATCWAIVTKDGRFAYTANAGSSTLTGFAVGADAGLTRLSNDGVSATLGGGSAPLDLDVTRDSRFVYALAAGSGNVAGYAIAANGSLTSIGETAAVAPHSGQMGIAAY